MKILKQYIRDIFYGANDGIITTFAVVTGAAGAALGDKIILILGFSNLIADGFSMAASNYLGNRSEHETHNGNAEIDNTRLYKHATATFISFVLAGSLPLLPYAFNSGGFLVACLATGVTLFVIGAFLGKIVVHGRWFSWGFRMLLVGGTAATIAFIIGRIIGQFLGA